MGARPEAPQAGVRPMTVTAPTRRPGMSSTLGASCSSHRRATCAGVIPRRAAVRTTTGLVSTGLSGPRGQPSGQNGTNAMPRRRHSSRTGVP